MSIVTRNRISGVVCRFSTGSEAPYYGRVEEWYYPLKDSLRRVGVIVLSEIPVLYQSEGDGRLVVTNGQEEMYVYFTYYQMQSGKWEIICYLT